MLGLDKSTIPSLIATGSSYPSSKIHGQGGNARNQIDLKTYQQQVQQYSAPGHKRSNAIFRESRRTLSIAQLLHLHYVRQKTLRVDDDRLRVRSRYRVSAVYALYCGVLV